MSNLWPQKLYRRPASRLRQLGRYALLVGFSNLLFAFAIAFSTNHQAFWSALHFFKPVNHSIAVEKSDLLAVSRLQRVDNDMLASLAIAPSKSGLNITRVELSRITVENYEPLSLDDNYPVDGVTSGPETPDSATYALDQQIENDDPSLGVASSATAPESAQKVSPILLKDKTTGHLQIGNFKLFSMDGGIDECLKVGESMLGDVGFSKNQLNILVASKQITIGKICASNGVIVISCRSQQITISPRRFQVDDKCKNVG